MVNVAEAVARSDFPLRNKDPQLVNGPSDNWSPPVWGLSAQEQRGLLGPGVLCLQDGVGRLCMEVTASRSLAAAVMTHSPATL